MLKPSKSAKFNRDIRRMLKCGKKLDKLNEVVLALCREENLDPKYRDHALHGDWIGHRECHIEPDWLLVYRIDGVNLILELCRTGSHADLEF